MSFSDIKQQDWVARLLPASWQPYARLMRLDRPVGIWLLLWPSLWALALLAPKEAATVWMAAAFALGAVLMRGAGCVVNDILDRDFDRQVERTKSRPLASGAVSVRQAIVLLAVLLGLSLLILLSFNWTAIITGAASLVMVGLYPLMKRITWWPQAFLGLTFNWGVLLASAAVLGGFPPASWLLYAAGFFWTLGYDTIYAHADKQDDALIGVKSTARRLGAKSPLFVAGCYVAMLLCLVVALLLQQVPLTGIMGLMLVAGHLLWQLKGWRMDDPADCIARFKSNQWTGLFVTLALLTATLSPSP